MPAIYRICLTGGPCAGKTTALTYLQHVLSQKGFRVFCVPEAATLLMKGGAMINVGTFAFNQAVKFQTTLMRTQMALEDLFGEMARNEAKPAVILCDRGLMDGSAYVSEELWSAVLDEVGLSTMQLRDKRYDGVIHMVTAADGAPSFYNKGNEARYENLKEAIDVDKRLRYAYLGHSRFFIVDNSVTHFNGKIDKCLDIVSKIIGLPSPSHHNKKYLIKIPDPTDHQSLGFPAGCKLDTFEVIETILKPQGGGQEDVEIYLRKRGKTNAYSYTQEIRYTTNNQRIVKSRIITAREYLELMQQKVPQMNTLRKQRTSFEYENHAYTIETILNIEGRPTFLRAETHADSSFQIPPFIQVIKDVTSQKVYSSPSLAHVDFKLGAEQLAAL